MVEVACVVVRVVRGLLGAALVTLLGGGEGFSLILITGGGGGTLAGGPGGRPEKDNRTAHLCTLW